MSHPAINVAHLEVNRRATALEGAVKDSEETIAWMRTCFAKGKFRPLTAVLHSTYNEGPIGVYARGARGEGGGRSNSRNESLILWKQESPRGYARNHKEVPHPLKKALGRWRNIRCVY